MTWDALFTHLPTAALIGWLASIGIPYLSALFTKKPSHLTGIITAVLSLLDGFLVELSNQNGHYQWGTAAGQAFLAWLTAITWHSKVLAGTKTEASLYATGITAKAPAAP